MDVFTACQEKGTPSPKNRKMHHRTAFLLKTMIQSTSILPPRFLHNMIKFITKLIPALLISCASFASQSYTISSCQDLQNMENDLEGNYTLNQDIDCTGFVWHSIPGFFQGTLDGQGFIINNLTLHHDIVNHSPDWHFMAIFEQLYRAKISNLTIKKAVFEMKTPSTETPIEQPIKTPLRAAQLKQMGPGEDATVGGIIAVMAYETTFENISFDTIRADLSTVGSFGLLAAVTKNSTIHKLNINRSVISIDGECVAGFAVGSMMNDTDKIDTNWVLEANISDSVLVVNAKTAFLGVVAGQLTGGSLIQNQLNNITIKNRYTSDYESTIP
jgi:hypothetical protein